MTTSLETTIVLVEDDPGHARLIEKHLRRAGLANPIAAFGDGRAALDFLLPREGDGREHAAQLLILLDLGLPGVDGYEVLSRLKADPRTRRVPVVVLTATDNPREIERCHALGCNGYIVKPAEQEQFSDVLQRLGMFLTIVKVPFTREDHG